MQAIIKKFLPDILIFLGVLLILQPSFYHPSGLCLKGFNCDSFEWNEIGVLVFLIGVDIIIRRYLSRKDRHVDKNKD